MPPTLAGAPLPTNPWQMWADYGTDLAQRSLLFWDTLRQRGNTALEHELAGKPPVLHFDYEMVLDARHFEKPVNYALIRIVPKYCRASVFSRPRSSRGVFCAAMRANEMFCATEKVSRAVLDETAAVVKEVLSK